MSRVNRKVYSLVTIVIYMRKQDARVTSQNLCQCGFYLHNYPLNWQSKPFIVSLSPKHNCASNHKIQRSSGRIYSIIEKPFILQSLVSLYYVFFFVHLHFRDFHCDEWFGSPRK